MKKVLICFLALFCCAFAFAQTRMVRGRITNAEGKPVQYASVTVKGTTTGVPANESGEFSIPAAPNSVLVISASGYQTSEVNIGNQTDLNISLKNSGSLGEVVVTAMGISRNAKSLGYSTTTLKSEEILKARETNVINSLEGKVAGVKITTQSGTTGGSSKVVIRGVSTLNNIASPGNGQPIFVIDGLPIDNSTIQINTVNPTAANPTPQGSTSVDFGNRGGDLNSDDIESITILKGASATALYGARAKDGAIIITTKRGRKGQTSISINSSVRMDKVLILPELQNEFAQGNQGVYNIANTNGWGPRISEVQDKTFLDFLGRQVTLKAFPNNVADFYKTGHTYINSVAFEGGGESGDYRFSYTNNKETGIIPSEEFTRNNIAFNAGRNVAKGLDVRTSINYSRSNSNGRPLQSTNNQSAIQSIIATLPRTVDIHDLEANVIDPVTKQQITLTPGKTGNNPYWVVQNNLSGNTVDRMFGNGVITFSPMKWLTISDNIGTDFYYEYRKAVTRPGTVGALTGNFFTANLYNQIINNDLLLTVTRQLTKDIGLKVIAGHNVNQVSFRREQADAQGLTVDSLYTFANASAVSTNNATNRRRLVGIYEDVGFSYKDILFLNVTGRNDWTSTLPKNNNSYFYPSVSSSFVFSDLLPRLTWMDYGKVRGSWANVGSDAAAYQLAFAYLTLPSAFVQYNLNIQFPFNGANAFITPNSLPNANLLPQNQVYFDYGLDLKMFKNRVNLDVTYYNSKTDEQIINLNVPRSTGFFNKVVNAGSIQNKGIEITLVVAPVRTKDLSWNVDFNFSKNKQTAQLPKEINSLTLQGGFSGLSIKTRSGEPFAIWGTAWLRDSLGNIVIDANTGLRKTKADQNLGNVAPDWNMGINNTLSYKGLSFSFLVDIREGGVLWSGTNAILRSQGLAKETAIGRDKIIIDRGVVLDPSTNKYIPNTVPVQSMQDFWGQFSTANTEANVFDASYVKLREVRLSYRIPTGFFTRHANFIKGIELGLEGRNLWIIKSYVPNIDPEVNLFGAQSLGEGAEYYNVPSSRSFGVNLRIKI
ncbi:MAG TPA: SusC/RagA family TonB-linked outer membrane protein [Flavisolibacter sp.]|jgi:TonB-linked SusC/RagA family outer membrane protein|nr:SusC/RagA family TonB-linked outer membrane protein [Flavisolibacter sp.]